MRYKELSRLRIASGMSLMQIEASVVQVKTDWLVFADSSYQMTLKDQDIDFDFETSDKNAVFIPQIFLYNEQTQGAFGTKLSHFNIQTNLKIRPIVVEDIVEPDFIPFVMIVHKQNLIRLLKSCICPFSLFLNFSLDLQQKQQQINLVSDWLACVKLRDGLPQDRLLLAKRYNFGTEDYIKFTENLEDVDSPIRLINKSIKQDKLGLSHLFKRCNNNNLVLSDSSSKEFESLQHNYISFSTSFSTKSDYHIVTDFDTLNNVNKERAVVQLSMPSVRQAWPIFAPDYEPFATFGIKQFSHNINFCPPFTVSEFSLLTALEILCSFHPQKIVVLSDKLLSVLLAPSDDASSIKNQVFLTKILEFCVIKKISLKIMGDLCGIN